MLKVHQLTGMLRGPQDAERYGVLAGRRGGRGNRGDDGHGFLSVSSARRMPDTTISYRHDTGPWLNAEQGSGRWKNAFVALEDLWI